MRPGEEKGGEKLNGRSHSNYAKRDKRWPNKNKTDCSGPSSQKNALLKQCTVFRCGNEAVTSFQMVHPASRNSDHKTTNQRLFVGLHTHFYSDTFHYSLRSFCAVQLPTCRSSRLLSVLCRQLAASTLLHITPLSRPKSNNLTFLALFRATTGQPQQNNLTDRCWNGG